MYKNLVSSENNNFENNLGFTQADLLILEIKKPNRNIIHKNESISRKNIRNKSSFISLDNDIKYKNPKVRI